MRRPRPGRRLPAAAAALVLTAVLLTGAPSPTVTGAEAAAGTRHVPDLLTPPEAVTTELRYCAFPSMVRAADGVGLVAYRHGSGHASTDGALRVRRTTTGSGWSDPQVLVDEAGTYAWGPAGMAAETTGQGGRTYLAAVRYAGSSGSSASDFSAHLLTRSSTGVWSAPAAIPHVIAPGRTYPSDVHVAADGTLLAAVYDGAPPSGTYGVGKVIASTDGGATWSTRGTLAISGRHVTEPQLATLTDGRLLAVIRSDAPAPYYHYLYRSYSSDGGATWSTPAIIVVHGSGLPALHVLPDTGEIVIVYRGFSEAENPPPAYPLAVAMLHPDGAPQRPAAEQGLDALAGDDALFLYGGILPGTADVPDQLVWSSEGAGGAGGSAAVVYAAPITWVPVPA